VKGTRGYIERVVFQINGCYEKLVRRLRGDDAPIDRNADYECLRSTNRRQNQERSQW